MTSIFSIRKLFLLSLAASLILSFSIPKKTYAKQLPEVVINEVNWAGSPTGRADQWLELFNTTNQAIDLTGWRLTNAAVGSDFEISSFTAIQLSIPSHGFYLISHFDNGTPTSTLSIASDAASSLFTLGPSCLPINLERPDLTVVDQVGCAGTAYLAGHGGTNFASMERKIGSADGLLGASWQTSRGFAHLNNLFVGEQTATPKTINDATSPQITNAQVTVQGTKGRTDFADSQTLLANWSGFADPESGITGYSVGLGTNWRTPNIVNWTDPYKNPLTQPSYKFTSAPLGQNQKYYVLVRAINGAGELSLVTVSPPITYNSLPPDAPTGLKVIDTPNDNGGQVTLSWTAPQAIFNPDLINYEVNYRVKGTPNWSAITVDLPTQAVMHGLQNGVTYEFALKSIDVFGNRSVPTPIVTATPLDNLAPIFSVPNLVLKENAPGSADTLSGAPGALSEAGVIKIYSRFPLTGSGDLIGQTVVNFDGSFSPISLGDNAYARIWIQAFDSSGNASQVLEIDNDITAPNSPTLTSLVSSCPSQTCRITLNWHNNGPDTLFYRVAYSNGNQMFLTAPLTGTALVLDVPSNQTYSFEVIAYDAAANQSLASNVFWLVAKTGEQTTLNLVNGQVVITSHPLSGSSTVSSTTARRSTTLIPQAEAADNGTTNSNGAISSPTNNPPSAATPTTSTPTSVAPKTDDWPKIVVAVIVLLAVAAGFYALAMSLKNSANQASKKPTEPQVTSPPKRRRGRPAKTTKITKPAPRKRGRPPKGAQR